jgi:hypothetical protein
MKFNTHKIRNFKPLPAVERALMETQRLERIRTLKKQLEIERDEKQDLQKAIENSLKNNIIVITYVTFLKLKFFILS